MNYAMIRYMLGWVCCFEGTFMVLPLMTALIYGEQRSGLSFLAVMAVCGLWYGFAGFKDDSKSYFCSKCGTILSTVAIAGWFFIVCLGLAG